MFGRQRSANPSTLTRGAPEQHRRDEVDACSRSTRRTRILFLLSSFRVGGAERVMCHLLSSLPRSQFDIHLAVVNPTGPLRSSIPPDVCVHEWKTRRASRSMFALLRLVWSIRPDRILSTGSQLNVLAGLLRPFYPPGCRLLVRESATVLQLGQSWNGWLKPLAAIAYRKADAVIAQSTAGANELRNQLHLPHDRVGHIYNPVPFELIQTTVTSEASPFPAESAGPHLVSVARLDPVKRLDHLIEAFTKLLVHRPNAHLWIVGEGSERADLEELIRSSGLQNQVHLVGFDNNPWRWMRHADLFVLCSQFESLPNSLLEAIAWRCPVVTLDIPGGTREIMEQLGLESRIVKRLEDWCDAWFERPDETTHQRATDLLGLETIVAQYSRRLVAHETCIADEADAEPASNEFPQAAVFN